MGSWRRGVVVTTIAQFHSTKPKLRFCAGSNPARAMSEIRDDEDLWQWSRLEIRLTVFRRSTIPQKQFIIIIIIIIKCGFKLCKKKTAVIISDSMLKNLSGANFSRYIEKKNG